MGNKSHPGNLKVLTKGQIKEAYDYQNKRSWDFYSERAFIETILNQNVNFIIALFGLIITAGFAVNNKHNQFIIWFLGLFLMLLFSLTSLRVTARLQVILVILHSLEDNDVIPIIQKEVDKFKWPIRNHTFAFRYAVIPFIFAIVMAILLFANYSGLFHFPNIQ